MHEPDGTQLPLVEAFGEQLERAMAKRGGPRRSQRRVLATACAAGLVAVSLLTAPGQAATSLVGEWLGVAAPGDPATVDGPRPRGNLQREPNSATVSQPGAPPTAPATSSCSRASPGLPSQIEPPGISGIA